MARVSQAILSGFLKLLPAQKRTLFAKFSYRVAESSLEQEEKNRLRKTMMDAVFGGLYPPWPAEETWAWRKFAYDRFMYPFTMQTSYELSRAYGLLGLLGRVKNVPGDLVECGVGYGKSMTVLIFGAHILELDKTVFGFDSFAGFPPATEEDIGPRVPEIGKPAGWTATSTAYIESIFRTDQQREDSILNRVKVPLRLIPGFFADTLPEHVPDQIAFLHVDCDLYESTRDVLTYCLPRVSAGGIVLFDEYQDPKWPGATQAIDEVGAGRNLELVYFPPLDRYGWQL